MQLIATAEPEKALLAEQNRANGGKSPPCCHVWNDRDSSAKLSPSKYKATQGRQTA